MFYFCSKQKEADASDRPDSAAPSAGDPARSVWRRVARSPNQEDMAPMRLILKKLAALEGRSRAGSPERPSRPEYPLQDLENIDFAPGDPTDLKPSLPDVVGGTLPRSAPCPSLANRPENRPQRLDIPESAPETGGLKRAGRPGWERRRPDAEEKQSAIAAG